MAPRPKAPRAQDTEGGLPNPSQAEGDSEEEDSELKDGDLETSEEEETER